MNLAQRRWLGLVVACGWLASAGLPVTAQQQQVVWPSIETQMAVAHVIPGSALERLILDNQDFQLLHPQENSDTLGLPPWLRVVCRKGNPNWKYSPRRWSRSSAASDRAVPRREPDSDRRGPCVDAKSALQELVQVRGWPLPSYEVIAAIGPDHAKYFTVDVRLRGELAGRGEGRSKKEPQQQAAAAALERLRAESEPPAEP